MMSHLDCFLCKFVPNIIKVPSIIFAFLSSPFFYSVVWFLYKIYIMNEWPKLIRMWFMLRLSALKFFMPLTYWLFLCWKAWLCCHIVIILVAHIHFLCSVSPSRLCWTQTTRSKRNRPWKRGITGQILSWSSTSVLGGVACMFSACGLQCEHRYPLKTGLLLLFEQLRLAHSCIEGRQWLLPWAGL